MLESELSSAILIANRLSRVLKLLSSNACAIVNDTFALNMSRGTLVASDVVPTTDFASKITSLADDWVAVRSRLAFSTTKVSGLVIELSHSLTTWLRTVAWRISQARSTSYAMHSNAVSYWSLLTDSFVVSYWSLLGPSRLLQGSISLKPIDCRLLPGCCS
jgi:hypothetical protein